MMPFFVMGLFVSVLFCGLSVDVGLLEYERVKMQTAADAAAIAEEMRFERLNQYDGTDGTDGFSAAATYGYINGVNNTTVTSTNGLYTAAATGDYKGHYDIVQMAITRQVQTYFMGIFNSGKVAVSATGIAEPPPCMFLMNTKSLVPYTVSLANTAAIGQSYIKCPAYIAGNLSVPAGAWWQAYQNYLTGASTSSFLLGRVKSGTTFNSLVRPDPLASIAQPTAGACTYNNLTYISPPGTITLTPGTYCGSKTAGIVTPGLTLFNATVILTPGLYTFTGGINWTFSNVTTSGGVTLFFTKVANTTSYGTVNVDVYSTTTLSAASGGTLGAPTTGGAIEGLLFFCDRNWVNSTSQDFQFQGNSYLKGVFYLPDTGLALINGSSHCTGYCAVIADNLYLANYAFYLTGTDYTMYPGPNPLRSTSVVVQ
jgi:hypothetical protein